MNIYLEIFGYIGTVLVVLSMMMTSLTKLRIINIIGSILSTIYSIICNTWPIVIMNICLIIINIYHLIKSLKNNNSYHIIQTNNTDELLLTFLSNKTNNIEFNTSYDYYLIYHNYTIAGILVGKKINNTFEIEICYLTNNYNYIFNTIIFPFFKNNSIDKLKIKKVANKKLAKLFKNYDELYLIKEL